MNEILYTFIIPHKNVPDLLQICIDTIPKNDEVQIVIVDDNSSEDVVDFENFPGLTEKCCEVYFTKEGYGAGFARNVGLSKAKGKWVLFSDADDYFTNNVMSIIDKYKDSSKDIIFFGLDKETNLSVQGKFYQNLLNGYDENIISSVDKLKFKSWTPWSKMFRREFVESHKLYFEERIIGNDCFFVLNANFNAESIEVCLEELYCHIYHQSSLSYSHKNDWEYYREKYLLNIWRNKFYKNIDKGHWQGYGIYSSLRSVFKLYGFTKFMVALFLAIKHKADFITPLKKNIFNRELY